jgi:branched-chain amino acid transport system permease protein
MIVLGGLGSVGGAALGALFVSATPLVFQRYADELPFVSGVGEGGLAAGEAARFLYGAAIILVILFEPAGLAGLGRRFRRKGRDPGRGRDPGGGDDPGAVATSDPDPTSPPTSPAPSTRPAQGSTS